MGLTLTISQVSVHRCGTGAWAVALRKRDVRIDRRRLCRTSVINDGHPPIYPQFDVRTCTDQVHAHTEWSLEEGSPPTQESSASKRQDAGWIQIRLGSARRFILRDLAHVRFGRHRPHARESLSGVVRSVPSRESGDPRITMMACRVGRAFVPTCSYPPCVFTRAKQHACTRVHVGTYGHVRTPMHD